MSETDPEDVRESTPGSSGSHHAEGGMGVSSERIGHSGPGQHTTDGIRDTSVAQQTNQQTKPQTKPQTEQQAEQQADPDVPPEQSPGGDETNPEGLRPKAGYPSRDPRS